MRYGLGEVVSDTLLQGRHSMDSDRRKSTKTIWREEEPCAGSRVLPYRVVGLSYSEGLAR